MAIIWNEVNAAHLFRRAGFGGTPDEVSQAVTAGLGATVDRLVNYESISNSLMDSKIQAQNLDLTQFGAIIRWWYTRLVFSAHPLEERMTLFWHDHFATAFSKVGQPPQLLTQNILLRKYALGNFVNLTIDISKDVAMLIWLDNYLSTKDHPNENYGRELLELFTLGQGFYSELDVLSASKAFTGWTFNRATRTFVFNDRDHDHTQKDFLGRVGDFNGDDVVRIACSEFAHAQLIARKLFSFFAYTNPSTEVVNRFAQIYLDAGNEIKPLVVAILTDPEMYSEKALWSIVKSPVDHCVIGMRQLRVENEAAIRVLPGAADFQGMTLFNPPDVSGWDGGFTWVSSSTLLGRMNFANSMISAYFDPVRFQQGATYSNPGDMVDLYLRRLGPVTVSSATRQQLINYVAPNGGSLPVGTALTTKQRGLAHMILSLPEWQMY